MLGARKGAMEPVLNGGHAGKREHSGDSWCSGRSSLPCSLDLDSARRHTSGHSCEGVSREVYCSREDMSSDRVAPSKGIPDPERPEAKADFFSSRSHPGVGGAMLDQRHPRPQWEAPPFFPGSW